MPSSANTGLSGWLFETLLGPLMREIVGEDQLEN